MDFLEYRARDALLNRLDPRSKFLFFIVFTLITSFICNGVPLLFLLVCYIAIWTKGKIGREMLGLAKKLKVLFIFIFVIWTLIGLFQQNPGVVIFRTNMFSLELYDFYKSVVFIFRIYLMIAGFFTVIITTNFSDIILGLRKWKVPYAIAFGTGMLFQIIPIIMNEFNAIMDAQRSRGLELDDCGKIQKMKNYVTMSFPLLFRVLNKGHNISLAMYYYKLDFKVKRTSYKNIQVDKADILFIVSFILIAIACITLHFLFPFSV